MSRSYGPQALRVTNFDRAAGRCEYCLVPSLGVLFPHEPDHIVAEQHGGKTTLENLALACVHCNAFKGPNLSSVDLKAGPSCCFSIRRLTDGTIISVWMAREFCP